MMCMSFKKSRVSAAIVPKALEVSTCMGWSSVLLKLQPLARYAGRGYFAKLISFYR